MTSKELIYDVKTKLNKLDSQQYRNLRIPEIDWKLNEAQELFIKMVAFPRLYNHLGFERTQRNIDDIRTLVVSAENLEITNNNTVLPDNYWHYLRGRVQMSKNNCENIEGIVKIRQHDDEFESSPFSKSSFEWRTVNAVFNSEGLSFFTDGSFNLNSCNITYIRRPLYIHNAEDFTGGTYKLPSGEILAGTQDSELPEHTHREIVDIAVLLITGELQIPDYQIKLNKLNFNDLK